MKLRSIAVSAACCALLLAACGDTGGGYSRGVFYGLVIDKTEAQVKSKLGEPVEVQKLDDDHVRYVYHGKTFDPDNLNASDKRTILELERKDGQLIVVDVSFG